MVSIEPEDKDGTVECKKYYFAMGVMKTFLKNQWDRFSCIGLVILISTILAIMSPGCTKTKEPIKIGLTTTLTGTSSTSGIHARNAAMLAVEQINESGGINGRLVKLIVRDDKGSGVKA